MRIRPVIHGEEIFHPGRIRLTPLRCVVEKPNHIAVGIQVILLCGLNHAVDHSAGLSPSRGIGKEPILSAHHKGLYAALGTVAEEFQPAVFQIAHL